MPSMHVAVPYNSAISDQNVMWIAQQVRDIMRHELDTLVSAKVKHAASDLQTEVNQLKADNT